MDHGILLLDKPIGISSHLAMRRAQRLLSFKKAGHMGTLDVMATGMLPLCLGEATRFASWGLKHDKCYTVSALMGQATSTGDVEGEVIQEASFDGIAQDAMTAVLPKWTGSILQTPPMHSALKHKGEPLYALARRGESVERKARSIQVHSIELLSWDLPHWSLRICAGSGLYVRTLVEDLAKSVGSVAHVTALHRDWVDPWQEQKAVSLEEVEALGPSCLTPTHTLFHDVPGLTLDADIITRLLSGLTHANIDQKPGLYCLQSTSGIWLGLGLVDEEGTLRVKRLFSNACLERALAQASS